MKSCEFAETLETTSVSFLTSTLLSQSLCTFISAASKFAQLQCLWRSKDAGQVSTLSWAMATYTCMGEYHVLDMKTQ